MEDLAARFDKILNAVDDTDKDKNEDDDDDYIIRKLQGAEPLINSA
jgi:hypothetical protein